MRCMTSSQTVKRLLLVLGFIGQLQSFNMAQSSCMLTSQSHENENCRDKINNPLRDDDVDLFFADDLDLPVAPCENSRHASVLSHEEEDSDAESFSMEMERALRDAMGSGTLTPLLKEELRCKIQLRRLQHGKEELTPDFSVKPSAMSVEEVIKRNRKMQQNRQSAQRSRDRRKSVERSINDRLEQLQKDNQLLEDEVRQLRHACHVARTWLQEHRACLDNCRSPHSSDPSLPKGPPHPTELQSAPEKFKKRSISSGSSVSSPRLSNSPSLVFFGSEQIPESVFENFGRQKAGRERETSRQLSDSSTGSQMSCVSSSSGLSSTSSCGTLSP